MNKEDLLAHKKQQTRMGRERAERKEVLREEEDDLEMGASEENIRTKRRAGFQQIVDVSDYSRGSSSPTDLGAGSQQIVGARSTSQNKRPAHLLAYKQQRKLIEKMIAGRRGMIAGGADAKPDDHEAIKNRGGAKIGDRDRIIGEKEARISELTKPELRLVRGDSPKRGDVCVWNGTRRGGSGRWGQMQSTRWDKCSPSGGKCHSTTSGDLGTNVIASWDVARQLVRRRGNNRRTREPNRRVRSSGPQHGV